MEAEIKWSYYDGNYFRLSFKEHESFLIEGYLFVRSLKKSGSCEFDNSIRWNYWHSHWYDKIRQKKLFWVIMNNVLRAECFWKPWNNRLKILMKIFLGYWRTNTMQSNSQSHKYLQSLRQSCQRRNTKFTCGRKIWKPSACSILAGYIGFTCELSVSFTRSNTSE